MKIDTFHSNNLCEISIHTIKVEPISASQVGDVKNLIIQTNPTNRNISIDNAYVVHTSVNNSEAILGVVCIEPNDVRTKYDIQGEDIEKKNYHEITYFLIEDRLFNEVTLIPLLRQLISQCVSDEPIDEVFWVSNGELYSQIINKVFKTCNEYYFQNEAEYFANKLISKHIEHSNRVAYVEKLIKKNAPE